MSTPLKINMATITVEQACMMADAGISPILSDGVVKGIELYA